MTANTIDESGGEIIPRHGDAPGEPRPSGLLCPQCGSARIRRGSTPFVVCLVAGAALVTLGLISLTAESCLMAPIVLVGALILALVLPMTLWTLFIGRHRCRSCGHRFAPSLWRWQKDIGSAFLWPWLIAGHVLLFLVCVAVPVVLRMYVSGFDVGLPLVTLIAKYVVCAWLLAACQAVIYVGLRRRMQRQAVWSVLLALPALPFGYNSIHHALPHVRADAVLASIGTAALPQSAHDIRVWTLWIPDQQDAYVRFTADPNDIARFIAESTMLEGAVFEGADVSRDRAPISGEDSSVASHSAYFTDEWDPSWFCERLEVSTRRYFVLPGDRRVATEVAIDGRQNTVYVHQRYFPPD